MRTLGVGGVVVLVAGGAAAQNPVFRSAPTFSLSGSAGDNAPIAIVADVGSLNGNGGPDGIPDLITANRNQLAPVLFGNGDGTFSAGPNTNLQTIPTALAVGLGVNEIVQPGRIETVPW